MPSAVRSSKLAQGFGHFGHRERSLNQLAWKAQRLYDDSDPKQPRFQHARSFRAKRLGAAQ